MPDDPDPPRKVYGFKPREFERANEAPAAAPTNPPPTTAGHLGPTAGVPETKIDVRELVRVGAGNQSQLGYNKVANRANDVHGILRKNFSHDQAAGHFELGPLDDTVRRRRIRNYWIAVAAINVPLGSIAYLVGHGAAIPFTFAIAGMGFITARLTWKTFFLRTHYRD